MRRYVYYSLLLVLTHSSKLSPQKMQPIAKAQQTVVNAVEAMILAAHPQELCSRVAELNRACNRFKDHLHQLGSTKKFWWTGRAKRASIKKINNQIASVAKLQQLLERAQPEQTTRIIKEHRSELQRMQTFIKQATKLLHKHKLY